MYVILVTSYNRPPEQLGLNDQCWGSLLRAEELATINGWPAEITVIQDTWSYCLMSHVIGYGLQCPLMVLTTGRFRPTDAFIKL